MPTSSHTKGYHIPIAVEHHSASRVHWRLYCAQPRPGEYNEKAFQALDKAIAVANERNIRVILVLSNYWTSTG